MSTHPKLLGALAATAVLASMLSVSSTAAAHTTGIHDNCTAFNKQYPHGVGLVRARDRVGGTTAPVTTFKRSDAVYRAADRHNGSLDRDNDGVACEKR